MMRRLSLLCLSALGLFSGCARSDAELPTAELSSLAVGVHFDSSSTQLSHVDLVVPQNDDGFRYEGASLIHEEAPWGVGPSRLWEKQVHFQPVVGWTAEHEFWLNFWLLDVFSIHREKLRNPEDIANRNAKALFQAMASDSFTYYITPAQAQAFDDMLDGVNPDSLMGIVFSPFHTDTLVVGSLAADGAAKAAGVRRKDRLLSVNGSPSDPDSLMSRLSSLPRSARIALTVRHLAGDTETVSLVRRPAWFQPVWFDTLPGGHGYLRIDQFVADSTGPEVRAAVDALAGVVGTNGWILLDLRGNPGGEIETSLESAMALLPAGDSLVRIRTRSMDTASYRTDHGLLPSYQGATTERVPVVTRGTVLANPRILVLADGGTASAAELMLSALKDNLPADRFRQIGTRTFGKGIGQSILGTAAGGYARITSLEILPLHAPSYNAIGLAPTQATADSTALATALDGLGTAAGRVVARTFSDIRIRSANPRTRLAPLGFVRQNLSKPARD